MRDLQYRRSVSLIVSGTDLEGLDLSEFRIKFQTKQSDTATPNTADIFVYNLTQETAQRIKKEFKSVILQGGYESNFGVIFRGNIYQVIIGQESAVDHFVHIVAADGDRAYNFAVVNQTIAAGCTQMDQVQASIKAMNSRGVTQGHIGEFPTLQLPRGKVMYGSAKKYLSSAAETSGKNWSIQQEKVTMIPQSSYLPGEAVEINSKTGLVGFPQQTNTGVNLKCLLNPKINIGQRVKLNNSDIQGMRINVNVRPTLENLRNITPAALTPDGIYYVLTSEHSGDTRANDWYTSLVCLNVSPSSNPANSVGSY